MAIRNRWVTPLFLAAGLALSAQNADRAPKDFKACIVKGEGLWRFRAWMDEDDILTKVEVFDAQGKSVQLLKMDDFFELMEPGVHDFDFLDFNFDGNKDLAITRDQGATGNTSYEIYLFDPQRRRFVYSKELSEDMCSPEIDPKTRTIRCWANAGGAGCYHDDQYYQWIHRRLTMIERDIQDDKTHEVWKLKGGKLVLVLKEKSHCED